MSRWAVIFPGQGSQTVGMGWELFQHYSSAKLAFEEADDALGYPLSRAIFEGPAETLEDTEVQQPGILVVSVACWRALKQERPQFQPILGLGLSLGEYSAYVAAGAIRLSDAVRVTRLRGRAMQNAVPKGTGGMMAVIGLEAATVEDICRTASRTATVDPANYNAPGQIVVSGYLKGLDLAEALVRKAGGRTARLRVSAPFHSRLLEPAGLALREALAHVGLSSAAFPIVANVDAEYCREPDDIVNRLVAQVYRPVRFEASVRRAINDGVEHFLELGPGKSLASLVKKIDRAQTPLSVENPQGLGKALELV